MDSFDRHAATEILVVEDNSFDYEVVVRSFKKIGLLNPVFLCESGDQALDFLYRRNGYSDAQKAPRPAMILLDLNLPGTGGRDVLKEIKNDPLLKSIPVVILTTSNSDKDISECYLHGANSYITKPSEWEKYVKAMESFKNYWLEVAALPT